MNKAKQAKIYTDLTNTFTDIKQLDMLNRLIDLEKAIAIYHYKSKCDYKCKCVRV